MPETLEKLRPDRDLQCYFFQPSAIAALSDTAPDRFTVSGTWRQQFDWAVIEWNRDNVFEHLRFRYLPDGDLSGLVLSYEETRENCIPMDSTLFPTVDWPFLRVWAEADGLERIYYVPLRDHAEPVEGNYAPAYAEFTLSGTAVAGEVIGLAYAGLHYTYEIQPGDTLESALQHIVDGMNAAWSPLLRAVRTGTVLRAYYTEGRAIEDATTGHNGNRFALYSYATGSAVWDAPSRTFAHGVSPSKWRVTLNFATLQGYTRDASGALSASVVAVPTGKIRKMRWTYAAELQAGEFARTEFRVAVTNWTVTGTGRGYRVAGPGSLRIEDDDPVAVYSGTWTTSRGNYSGGSIRRSETPGASVTIPYRMAAAHTLYAGLRYTGSGATVRFLVDGSPAGELDLGMPGEDVLIRWPVAELSSGAHQLTITHVGETSEELFFDFVEAAAPVAELPEFPPLPTMTLATDWDTDHSLALAPERTAWMLHSLGFHGRQNHYVGALLFYELCNPDNVFAAGSVTFSGTPDVHALVSVTIGPAASPTTVERVIHAGDTPATIALSFAQEFNRGYTGIWASAAGGTLTIQSRLLGTAGNSYTLAAATNSANLGIAVSGATLSGGQDGAWRTDLTAEPRLNRAMRDWTVSFLKALKGYGISAVCAFSTELKHVDPSPAAGMAQRGPAGDPVLLPTPAIQTNFSPASLAFWRQVHADCAALMAEAGMTPYLQFGEVQWWYFPNDGLSLTYSGMPFYDDWAVAEFESRYGRPMAVFHSNDANPESFPEEVAFLSAILGEFTDAIMAHVRASFPDARFEVLYPFDVNQTAFNRSINFPVAAWTPAKLNCLKTEGLALTFTKNLAASEAGIGMGEALGFGPQQRSHLVGLGDATAPWLKEARIAEGRGFESVVLFALDQFCLIGYELPLPASMRRTVRVRR
jgi:hypothetical protein